MIVRNGSQVIDYGPTPAPRHAKGVINGSIVVPESTRWRSRSRDAEREKKARYRAKAAEKAA